MIDRSPQAAADPRRGLGSDSGVVSVRLHVNLPGPIPWLRLTGLVGTLADHPDLEALAADRRDQLLQRLQPAMRAMQLAGITEDYTVVRLTGLHDAAAALDPRTLASLFAHRSSCTTKDLTVLGWDAALVVEPDRYAPRRESRRDRRGPNRSP
jgi:hypothetical protein